MRLPNRSTPILCVAALCVLAQPALSQEARANMIRLEAGYSSNHDGDDTGVGGALRYVRAVGDDLVRFETGLIAGTPYLGLDAGVELRLPRRARLGFVLRAGGGLLLEDGFTGAYGRAGGGVEWRVGPRLAIRGTAQTGNHGGQAGPHPFYLGVDYRW